MVNRLISFILVNRWLGSQKTTSIAFMRQILAGKKKALIDEGIVRLLVPEYPEFTLQQLYSIFKNDKYVLEYLPDQDLQSRPPDRDWAYSVAYTLRK